MIARIHRDRTGRVAAIPQRRRREYKGLGKIAGYNDPRRRAGVDITGAGTDSAGESADE